MRTLLEYVWLDADEQLRSKIKIAEGDLCKLDRIPQWSYDGSSTASGIKIYNNGSLVSTTAESSGSYSAMSLTTQPIRIGENGYSLNADARDHFNGNIDIVRIYNKELSGVEVLNNYNTMKGRFQ